jgi:hypothetical protein
MPDVFSLICRSLLAGDSKRPLTDHALHRLPAGSYIPNKLRGIGPTVKECNLSLNRDMRNVDSVPKIISRFTGVVFGLVTDTVGGMLTSNPDLLKDLTAPLQDAGRKTGEKLKGLLDSLDKRRP